MLDLWVHLILYSTCITEMSGGGEGRGNGTLPPLLSCYASGILSPLLVLLVYALTHV